MARNVFKKIGFMQGTLGTEREAYWSSISIAMAKSGHIISHNLQPLQRSILFSTGKMYPLAFIFSEALIAFFGHIFTQIKQPLQ
jgi:hypothetical protein